MSGTRTALVIGGGIAGPVAAMALQKAGIEAVVHEARATGEDGDGMFLTVATNGIDALRALGLDAAALADGFATPTITLRSGNGRRLGGTATGGRLPDGTVSQTVRRADLCRALREQALARGIRFEHGRRLVEAHEQDGGVRAVFADGAEASADVLIGCDGVHSTVRRIVDPAAPAPTYAGLLATGGFAGAVPVPAEPGGYEMIFGKRAFFGYVVAPERDVWWFANLPRPDEPARGELAAVDGETWRSRMLELFADDAGPALALLRATDEIPSVSPIHAIPRLPRWHRGRMVVIGDAAHAPSPTSGQGASLSFEDAVVLALCLRDAPDHAAAFARFEAERRARVERIVKRAARMNSSKAAGPVGRVLRDALLPVVLRLTANGAAQRRVHEHHLEWDAPLARV